MRLNGPLPHVDISIVIIILLGYLVIDGERLEVRRLLVLRVLRDIHLIPTAVIHYRHRGILT